MRYPRIKPEVGAETFMHVYNRVAGPTGEFPFGPAEKEEFIRRLRRLTDFYIIDVIAYQVMGNHWHALIRVPADPPSNEEAAARFSRYYDGKRSIDPNSRRCNALHDNVTRGPTLSPRQKRSLWVPVRSSRSSSSVILYIRTQSGSM